MLRPELPIIEAAFNRVAHLESLFGDSIPWAAIKQGFDFAGETVLLANQVQGIFKPKVMSTGALSIKTTMPKGNQINIYDDRLDDKGFYRYSLEAGDPHGERNVYLWQSFEDRSPFVYFHAVAPGVYTAIWPCFVAAIHPKLGYCEIVVGDSDQYGENSSPDALYRPPSDFERKYEVRESKVRLHQASFRQAVITAYGKKCAISGLPEAKLIEAAHIIPDSHADGYAQVTNGIALSCLHHRAYDRNLIGIDPDYVVHVGDSLLSTSDGPLLENGLKGFHGAHLHLPKHDEDRPNRDYLARRFEQFSGEQ